MQHAGSLGCRSSSSSCCLIVQEQEHHISPCCLLFFLSDPSLINSNRKPWLSAPFFSGKLHKNTIDHHIFLSRSTHVGWIFSFASPTTTNKHPIDNSSNEQQQTPQPVATLCHLLPSPLFSVAHSRRQQGCRSSSPAATTTTTSRLQFSFLSSVLLASRPPHLSRFLSSLLRFILYPALLLRASLFHSRFASFSRTPHMRVG